MKLVALLIATIMAAFILMSVPSSASARNGPPSPDVQNASVPSNTITDADKPAPPKPFSRTDYLVDDVPLLPWQSVALSVIVLIFGTYVVTLQYKLLLASKSRPADSMRGLTVTTIVVLALAIVSSGFGREQITPVLGLFGTIVGYLLGSSNHTRSSEESDQRRPREEKDSDKHN